MHRIQKSGWEGRRCVWGIERVGFRGRDVQDEVGKVEGLQCHLEEPRFCIVRLGET